MGDLHFPHSNRAFVFSGTKGDADSWTVTKDRGLHSEGADVRDALNFEGTGPDVASWSERLTLPQETNLGAYAKCSCHVRRSTREQSNCLQAQRKNSQPETMELSCRHCGNL